MTKTITLTIAEAEIAMEAIAKYSELMESREETKWLSEDTGSIVTSIINQLEQADEEVQTFGTITAGIASHLTPSELSNYTLADVSITLINESTNEKIVLETTDSDLTDIQWIDDDKNDEEEATNVELAKLVLPLRQYEDEVNEVDEFISNIKSLQLDDEVLWKIAGTMNLAEVKEFASILVDAVEQLEMGGN